jgi:glyoxalase family protein
MQLLGLHHVTAVTGQAAQNVSFYTQVLGLRLIKKTVNQDDVSAYHLFYGDTLGSAGTEVTFFDWPDSPRKLHGKGTIASFALRVSGRDTLEWWAERLSNHGVVHGGIAEWGGTLGLAFTDPEGQNLVLVDDGGAPGGQPWEQSQVPTDRAIRGLHAVTLVVEELAPTAWVLTEVLGFRQVGSYPFPENDSRQVVRFAAGPTGPGTEVHIEERPELRSGRAGIGGIHHVAFRTPNEAEHQAWRERIARAGLGVTPVIDRYYFRSIYFREPGGTLFEIATDGPGFATDEDPAHLGERLALPPFLEPHRTQIEAGLRPLTAAGH